MWIKVHLTIGEYLYLHKRGFKYVRKLASFLSRLTFCTWIFSRILFLENPWRSIFVRIFRIPMTLLFHSVSFPRKKVIGELRYNWFLPISFVETTVEGTCTLHDSISWVELRKNLLESFWWEWTRYSGSQIWIVWPIWSLWWWVMLSQRNCRAVQKSTERPGILARTCKKRNAELFSKLR